ncbi:MAG: hypothetical protein AAFQ82_03205, partial [Myxococcota bacterium]
MMQCRWVGAAAFAWVVGASSVAAAGDDSYTQSYPAKGVKLVSVKVQSGTISVATKDSASEIVVEVEEI